MNVWVEAKVRFALVVPDDDNAADAQADNLSDNIVDALGPVVQAAGGYGESVSVIDWTTREDV